MILALICSKSFLIHFNFILSIWGERIKHCIGLSCLKSGDLIVDRIIVDLPYSVALSKIRSGGHIGIHHSIF